MVVIVWRLLLLPLFLLLSLATRDGVEAFAFTTPNPGAARARAAALPPRVGAPRTLASAGPPFFPRRVAAAAAAERNSLATSATKRGKEGDDDGDRIDMLTGSGLRGVDTSKLTGNEKRDADWFLRTNSRELVWFEDPVFYLGLCLIVPVVGLVWGALNCYIPGICPSTL
ncbi:unnamed protein product [Ectocarpus sp. 8 AP-2014]